MTGCFTWLFVIVGGIFIMMSLLRWFEQTTEAVDQGQWNKVATLVVVPFSVWLFTSRVSAGRPTVVPHHEPVRGFGGLPKGGIQDPASTTSDSPPPGTPREFIGLPNIPQKPKLSKPAIDPEQIAKLRQKMREQGMLGDDE